LVAGSAPGASCHGDREVNLTFYQLKAVLLERIKQVAASRRNLGLHALPGSKVCFSQRRRIIAQTHNG
jgi:hypothetical protein